MISYLLSLILPTPEFKTPHPPPSLPQVSSPHAPSHPPGQVHSTGAALLIGFHSLRGKEEGRQYNTNSGTQIYLGIYIPLPPTNTYSGTFRDLCLSVDTCVLGKTLKK